MAISSACDPGIIGPDTAPCSTRNRTSEPRLQEIPHSNEASVNSRTEMTKVRTTPKRCIMKALTGTEMPLDAAKDVMTQVPWSELTPRLPAMVGIETLAIELNRAPA
jgi:hypothetical protein